MLAFKMGSALGSESSIVPTDTRCWSAGMLGDFRICQEGLSDIILDLLLYSRVSQGLIISDQSSPDQDLLTYR